MIEWNEGRRSPAGLERRKQIFGVEDRTEGNRQTMAGTLDHLAAALED